MAEADLISERIEGAIDSVTDLRAQREAIGRITEAVADCLERGGTLYTCGNGGSAAQALHLAEELIGRYRRQRPAQRAVCLNADPCALTCIANDYGFEQIFARQCEALLTPDDVLVVMSTSGTSPNIVNALVAARRREAKAIGLLGKGGGQALDMCDLAIVCAGRDSAHVQEAHQVIIHLICEIVEHRLVGAAEKTPG